jgi:hypothetical protein
MESNRLFSHMLYEYKKGVRRLALYTCNGEECQFCIKKLEKSNVTYHMAPAGNGRSNIFFGDCPCVRIIESFGAKKLNEYDEKEDFILGVMLGYDISKQCERYMENAPQETCKTCPESTKSKCAG